jgi:hypothetical protein
MKRSVLFSIALLALAQSSFAQFSEFRNYETPSNFTINSENNILQIGGRVSAFYGDRIMKTGQTNLKHNGFAMKDADLDITGTTKSKFVYEVQVSLLDIVNAAVSQNTADAGAPGIKAAYVSYEGKSLPIHIKLGYDKLPYSQGSMSDAYSTPMWSHANLVGGDFFSRRDLGLTLFKSLWQKRVHIYAGIYSGLGENVFEYGNDASGKPEYVGRIDFAYPSRYKYDVIDEDNTPKPVFRVGVNARYTDKTQPAGRSLSADVPDAPGAYGLRIVNGKKLVYGGDISIKYKGISLLFETDMVNMKPVDNADALYEATSASFNKGVVHAGGFVTGINYNFKKINSVFSVNYENINANDLANGKQEWLYLGYAYKINGFNSVLKIEYYKPMTEDYVSNALKYTDQFRIGYQIVF